MPYTINQLAKIANISVRTLHHYDKFGLLVSKRNQKNKYRIYEEKDLLKLQQILFFRELDFALDDIKNILEREDFDISSALKDHKQMILLKRKRLDSLIKTIDKTINKVTKKKYMKDEELYDSFTKKEMEELANEAKERWGHTSAYKESEQKMRSMTKEGMDQIKKEGDEIARKASLLIDRDVRDKEVQEVIAIHYKHLSNFYTPNPEMYRGLAEMYISDTRFTQYFENYKKGLAKFMHDAMIVFVEGK
ncbi:MAG: MerR family transcriptional regulator [Candidatus Paceibacterota bacterium]